MRKEKGAEILECWKRVPLSFESQAEPKFWLRFIDSLTVNLGADPDRAKFKTISGWVETGHYYPREVIEFHLSTDRVQPGTRVLQVIRLLPFLPEMASMVEIDIFEKSATHLTVGYVTTEKHFARGWWRAHFSFEGENLMLKVESVAVPGSLLYWCGLPVARYLQLRARRESIKRFKTL